MYNGRYTYSCLLDEAPRLSPKFVLPLWRTSSWSPLRPSWYSSFSGQWIGWEEFSTGNHGFSFFFYPWSYILVSESWFFGFWSGRRSGFFPMVELESFSLDGCDPPSRRLPSIRRPKLHRHLADSSAASHFLMAAWGRTAVGKCPAERLVFPPIKGMFRAGQVHFSSKRAEQHQEFTYLKPP